MDRDLSTRDRMTALRDRAIQTIHRGLAHTDRAIRALCAQAIEKLHPPLGPAFLAIALENEDPGTRFYALIAILEGHEPTKAGDPPELSRDLRSSLEALADAQWRIRYHGALSLAELACVDTLDPLECALSNDHEDPCVRVAAAIGCLNILITHDLVPIPSDPMALGDSTHLNPD